MITFNSLPYRPLRITSGYGDRTEQVKNIPGATRWHDGVDIGRDRAKYPSRTGACGNVLAVLDGVIVDKGFNNGRGFYLIIRHADQGGHRVETLYQHLHSEGLPLRTQVKAGQTIGRMGASGVGNATHLHFELRIDGKPVDPTKSLMAVGKTPKYSKTQEAVKKKYNFSDDTMTYLLSYKHADALMEAWALDKPREVSPETIKFIRKYRYGKEILRRVYGE